MRRGDEPGRWSFRRRGSALIVMAALLGSGACGVPLENDAHVIPGEDFPYDLDVTSTTDVSVAPSGSGSATVFLLRDDELVEVPRMVTDPADLAGLLTELTASLSPAETGQGLRRALNDAALLGGVDRAGRVATVELDADFDQFAPHEQLLALAQIVFTLTERDEVDRVQFSREGEPLTIPTATGSLVNGPVSRYDYRSLR